MTCASHNPGCAPLTPIPVAGPFDRIGVDVIQVFSVTDGKPIRLISWIIMTKWPEVFATSDQSAATIASLLVEQIVSRHGVPSEILSDRGKAFF